MVFNIANLLLVAAIDIAGLAVAFPVGIGLALIVGAVSSYLVSPAANPLLLFGGVALVTVAIVLDAAAYRKREAGVPADRSSSAGWEAGVLADRSSSAGWEAGVPADRSSSAGWEAGAKAATTRGIVLSLVAGVLMGLFYPLVARALSSAPGRPSPGPYAVAFFFALGLLVSTVPANLLLMAKPLNGEPPIAGADFWRAPLRWHVAGTLGGAIWCTGGLANFVASGAHLVGPAVSYSIGQGATMISACWGVFVWREFAGAPRSAKILLLLMFVFFAMGLGAVALAPLF
jgi:glucose uptake protein